MFVELLLCLVDESVCIPCENSPTHHDSKCISYLLVIHCVVQTHAPLSLLCG